MVQGLGFRGTEFGVCGRGFRAYIEGLRFSVYDSGFRVHGFRVYGLMFGV